MTNLSFGSIVVEDPPTFDEWQDEHSFEYTLSKNEVVDYLNAVVDYRVVDDATVESNDDVSIVEWSDGLEVCGITDDEQKSVVKTHITAYVNSQFRSNLNDRQTP